MRRRVWLIPLESYPSRYTEQWATHIPKLIKKAGFEVLEINGSQTGLYDTTPGAFVNWAGTNEYKSNQAASISAAFGYGNIKDGDVIFFTDFWNPAILQTRYMIEMLGVKAKIVALAHAGAYDPHDLLGQRCGNQTWVKHSENAMAAACDALVFATEFHRSMFFRSRQMPLGSAYVAGFPFEFVLNIFGKQEAKSEREDLIIFTQRNSPEKNPHIFDEIAALMPEYRFVNVQREGASKEQYHDYIRRAKLMLSFADQETLGITPYEALCGGCDILVPNHLSYKEMYSPAVKYNIHSHGTPRRATFLKRITASMSMSDTQRAEQCATELARVQEKFFSSAELIKILRTV